MPRNKADSIPDAHEVNRIILDGIFQEAVENGRFLTPDDAMRDMGARIQWMIGGAGKADLANRAKSLPRLNSIAVLKRAHKYAVDLFYRHILPLKRGAPSIPDEALALILSLHEQGKSHREIAEAQGFPLDTPAKAAASKDLIRKRIATAKKRKQ